MLPLTFLGKQLCICEKFVEQMEQIVQEYCIRITELYSVNRGLDMLSDTISPSLKHWDRKMGDML